MLETHFGFLKWDPSMSIDFPLEKGKGGDSILYSIYFFNVDTIYAQLNWMNVW